jgi:hypothetical protein
MIDKIEAMVEPGTDFRGELNELRRGSPWDPYSSILKPSKFYKAVADLRPLGFDAILHIEQKRYGTHKVELLETGKKGMTEIQSTLERIVDCDPGGCRVGRVDLCTDVRDVSLSWFREHVYVEYKQFLCAHAKLVESELSEMGKKVYQTLYFGKRPSCVRIYDKTAERMAHFALWKKREIRAAKKALRDSVAFKAPAERPPLLLPEFPTVTEWLAAEFSEMNSGVEASSGTSQFPVVTRVENQFGGRVPENLQTIDQVQKNVLEFNPFARMKVVAGNSKPPGRDDRNADGSYRYSPKDWAAGMWLREHWKSWGAPQMRSFWNRDRNGKRYLEQMCEFLPTDDDVPGISEMRLYERYRGSITRQLAA